MQKPPGPCAGLELDLACDLMNAGLGVMLALLDLFNPDYLFSSPIAWIGLAFQIWMLVDAVRRQEWIWAVLIFLFSVLTAVLYYFFVYRQAPALSGGGLRKFELPGTADRRRIHDLEAKIHNLDKAHHHAELGGIYLRQQKLQKAEECLRRALERDPDELDFQAQLGETLAAQGHHQEAKPLLEKVTANNPRHNYGETLMTLAECRRQLGEMDAAQAALRQVLESYTYPKARVRLAECYLQTGHYDLAQTEVNGVLEDGQHASGFQQKQDRIWIKQARALALQLRNKPSKAER